MSGEENGNSFNLEDAVHDLIDAGGVQRPIEHPVDRYNRLENEVNRMSQARLLEYISRALEGRLK